MPIDPATLHVFLLACLAVYVAPGPDMVYIGSHAMTHGVRVGAWAALGPVVGCWLQSTAAAVGLGAAIAAFPLVFTLVRWLGVAYLVHLGIRMLTGGGLVWGPVGAGTPTPGRVFVKGLAINLLNPKLALFFMAFLPQFVDPAKGGPHVQLACLGAIFATGACVWSVVQVVLFARAGRWIAGSAAAQRWQRRIAGGSFLGFAAALAFSEIRR